MARWEPNARERLERAAMELYRERGFEHTAVADIAAHAGLTERTFFRHFADKREVLFGGSVALEELLVRGIADAPSSMGPIDAVAAALETSSPLFEVRRPYARARLALIAATAALQERELIKFATLSAAVAVALRRRGVSEPAAALAADAGMAIFKLSFSRWTKDDRHRDLALHIREALAELKAVAAGGEPRSASRRKRPAPTSPAARRRSAR